MHIDFVYLIFQLEEFVNHESVTPFNQTVGKLVLKQQEEEKKSQLIPQAVESPFKKTFHQLYFVP